jgi:tetratricopeptide (TPR) repeat protein
MQAETDKVAHWRAVVAAKPTHQPAVRELAKALAESGAVDDVLALSRSYEADNPALADAVLQVATRHAPGEPRLWRAYCALAAARNDMPQQNLRWMMAYKRFAEDRDVQLGYADVLMRQKRFAAAESVAAAALSHTPDDIAMNELLASIAEHKRDWPEAVSYLTALARLAPERADIPPRLQAAEKEALLVEARTMRAQPLILPQGPIPPVPVSAYPEVRELLSHFESMGSNCEFGLLQRKVGAEPLGLLRFAGTLPRTALILLRSHFEGIGDPAEMTMTATPQEYRMRHMKSGWGMHTRIRPTPDVPEEKVMKDQCRHTTFLRRKLVKELEQQSKIFVYQRFVLTDREINDIFAAVQTYGPNMMMFVRVQDETHPAGSIEWRTDRLMIGAIDRAGLDRDEGWDISIDYWVHFCRAAKQRWDELHGPAVPALEATAA